MGHTLFSNTKTVVLGTGYADPWQLSYVTTGIGTSTISEIYLQPGAFGQIGTVPGVTGVLGTHIGHHAFAVLGETGIQG